MAAIRATDLQARYYALLRAERTQEQEQEFIHICSLLLDIILEANADVFKRLKER